jgi:hypothetical protein
MLQRSPPCQIFAAGAKGLKLIQQHRYQEWESRAQPYCQAGIQLAIPKAGQKKPWVLKELCLSGSSDKLLASTA